jgi:hypothetical protein
MLLCVTLQCGYSGVQGHHQHSQEELSLLASTRHPGVQGNHQYPQEELSLLASH